MMQQSKSFNAPPGFPTYNHFNSTGDLDSQALNNDYVHNIREHYDSVDQPSQQHHQQHQQHGLSYSTLGARLSSNSLNQDEYPPTRPSTAPLPQNIESSRREIADQANLALLIKSLQELTAVVAQHGEEIRQLREDARNYPALAAASHAATEQSARALSSFARIESRLAVMERADSMETHQQQQQQQQQQHHQHQQQQHHQHQQHHQQQHQHHHRTSSPPPPPSSTSSPWAAHPPVEHVVPGLLSRSQSTNNDHASSVGGGSHSNSRSTIARPPSQPVFLGGNPLEQHYGGGGGGSSAGGGEPSQPDDWSLSYTNLRGDGRDSASHFSSNSLASLNNLHIDDNNSNNNHQLHKPFSSAPGARVLGGLGGDLSPRFD